MKAGFFVTGTDTSIGKTYVCERILESAAHEGMSTLALKPVAAGAEAHACQDGSITLRNDDACALQTAMTAELHYGKINPVCLPIAASPHIAAAEAGVAIDFEELLSECKQSLSLGFDVTIIEGAGGWRVPLTSTRTMADLAAGLGVSVVLVVGMRLGCLNHALLSAEAIVADGMNLVGWIANELAFEMPYLRQNIETLQHRMPCPMLAHMPFDASLSSQSEARYSNSVLGNASNPIDIHRILQHTKT